MKLVIAGTVDLTSDEANIVGHMCYAARKLWNICSYERYSWSSSSGEPYPDWYVQKSAHKGDVWFKSLPAQTAQETLKRLDGGWKSFYALQKSGGVLNLRPPRYKQENMPIVYMQNGIVHNKAKRTARFTLTKGLRNFMQDHYGIKERFLVLENELFGRVDTIKQIVLYPPEKGRCRILIIYEIPDPVISEDNGHYLSIDLGLHNLMTCFDSAGETFIAGREYLSICRRWDKEIGRVQSQRHKAQKRKGIRYPHSSKHIRALYNKKHFAVKDYLHKVTTWLADYCAMNNISRVIIGDWTGIRKGKDFGRVTNQKLHGLPFAKLTAMLEYKLALRGIKLEIISEAWSSRCSPLSPAVSKKYACPRNRIVRGLYKDGNRIWNADSVGAFNIMRLWLAREHPARKIDPALLGTPTVIQVAV